MKRDIPSNRKYVPEGMFDIGLDQETKDFISQSLSNLQNVVKGGLELKLDFTSNLFGSAMKLFEYIKMQGGFLFDYLKFCFCVVFEVVNEKAKAYLSAIGEIFFGYQPEGVIDKAFVLLMYKSTIAKYIGDGDFLNIVRILGKAKSDTASANGSFDFVVSIIREVTHSINTWFNLSIPILNGDEPLDAFFQRFYTLKQQFNEKGASHYHIALALYALHDDVERYYRKNTDALIRDKIMYLLNCLRPLVNYCESTINPNNGPRVEPLAILITGPSGVGKSSFTTPVLLALLSRVLPKERLEEFKTNHNEFIFYRATENEYWDGYRASHEAIVFDDFGQMKDVAGGKNPDAFEIIRLKNTAPYHLHFAGIADKQKNYANPRILYATTNRNFLEFHSIVSNEAVIRRFDISVCQVPKPEFCKDSSPFDDPWKRRLDIDKVRAKYPYDPEDPSTFLAMDVIEFIEWDFVHGKPKEAGNVYTFQEFYQMCLKKFKELNTKGDAMLNYHKYIKSAYIAEGANETFYDAKDPIQAIKECFDRIATPNKLFSQEQVSTIVKVTGVCLSILAAIKFSMKFVSWFSQESNETKGKTSQVVKQQQVKASKAHKMSKNDRNRAHGKGSKEMRSLFKAQGADHTSLIIKLLKRNIYTLYANEQKVGNIIFLKGTTFIMPKHFDDLIDSTADEDGCIETSLRNPVTGQICFKWDWNEHLLTFEYDYDLLFVRMPLVYREHSDITNMFLPEKATRIGDKVVAVLPLMRNEMLMYTKVEVTYGQSVSYADTSSYLLNYFGETIAGDCGMPLVTFDTRFGSPKILGFHTAGSQYHFGRKACVGVGIFEEDLSEAFAFLEERSDYYEDVTLNDEFGTEAFGVINKLTPPPKATKTKIQPSLVAGKLYEPITKPAHLTPFSNNEGERINPELKAKEKYVHVNPSVPMAILNNAANFVEELVLTETQPQPWEPRVFSFEEAVAGVDGVPFADAIARSTSAGYPYTLDKKGKGKTRWLGTEGKVDFESPNISELRKVVDDTIKSAAKGIRKQHIFTDCLKDERRPIQKVEQGKTRQFMACPVELLIAIKQYFGDFVRSVCLNRIYNGVAVGINPYTEWEDLRKYLSPNANYNVAAGDYSSFDCKFPTQVSWKILDIIERYYSPTSTDEDKHVRRILFADIVNSLHIDSRGEVYEFIGSNPSGQPMTAVFNSIGNLIMLASVFYYDAPEGESIEQLRMTTFGDDHILGYPERQEYLFGSKNLARCLKELYDYEYTDETKSGVIQENRKIEDVAFLKRTFKYVRGQMCAPLDLSVILETLNWLKVGSTKEQFASRAEAVMTELAYHGEKVFDTHAPKILKAVYDAYGIKLENSTFERSFGSECRLAADF
jgi:hypothetical protein